MSRRDKLQRLWELVRPIEEDKAIQLAASWNAYFESCLDWVNGDGQTASFNDIEKKHNAAHQHVRSTICLYKTMIFCHAST